MSVVAIIKCEDEESYLPRKSRFKTRDTKFFCHRSIGSNQAMLELKGMFTFAMLVIDLADLIRQDVGQGTNPSHGSNAKGRKQEAGGTGQDGKLKFWMEI